MKSIFSSRRLLITLVFVLAVVLSACERATPREEEEVTASPTSPAIATPVQPVVPTVTTAAPVGETPVGGGEGQPTVDPAQGQPTATPIPDTGAGTQPTPAPPSQTGGQVTYVVTAGDTLFSIARRYNLTVEQVAAANNIDPNGLLVPGQTLIIPVAGGGAPPTDGQTPPGERTHVVAAGENLFRIGLRYGFTVAELAAYNNIANPHLIYVGQIIRIPPGGNP